MKDPFGSSVDQHLDIVIIIIIIIIINIIIIIIIIIIFKLKYNLHVYYQLITTACFGNVLLSSASQLSIYGQQLNKRLHARPRHILLVQYDCHIAVHGMELTECNFCPKQDHNYNQALHMILRIT